MPTVRQLISADIKAGTPLTQAVGKYSKLGVTDDLLDKEPEEALKEASRRKAERDITANTSAGLPKEATETTAESVSGPMLQTQWHPLTKLAALGEGFMEGMSDVAYPLHESPGRSKVAQQARKKAAESGKKLTPLQAAAQEVRLQRAKDIEEKPFVERVASDTMNILTGIPALAWGALGPTVIDVNKPVDPQVEAEGKQLGRSLPKGVAGALKASYESPEAALEYSQAEPVSAALDFVPVAGALLKFAKAGATAAKLAKVANVIGKVEAAPGAAVGKAAEVAGKGVDVAQAAAMKALPDFDWLKQGPLVERAARMLVDPTYHRTPSVKGFTQDLLTEPDRASKAIKRRGDVLSPEEGTPATATAPLSGRPVTVVGETKAAPAAAAIERELMDAADAMDLAETQYASIRTSAMSPSDPAVVQAKAAAEAARATVDRLTGELAVAERAAPGTKVATQVVDPAAALRSKEAVLRKAIQRKTVSPSAELSRDIAQLEQSIAKDKAALSGVLARQAAAETAPARVTGGANKLALDDIVTEVGKALPALTESGESVTKVVRQQLADLLVRDTRSLSEALRVPEFANKLKEVAGLSDQQMAALTKTANPLANLDTALTGRLLNAFNEVAAEIPDSSALRKKAIAATVEQIADETAKKSAKNMLDNEASRIIASEKGYADDPARAAISYAARLTAGTDQMPVQALRSAQNPKALAQELRSVANTAPDKAAAAKLMKEADRLDTFKQLSQELTGADHWVDPLLHTALTVEAEARKMLSNNSGFSSLFKSMKANLVARNLKSTFNNVVSNSLLQTVRRGAPLYDEVQTVKDIVNMKRAGGLDPKWNAIERSGIFDSNAVTQELGIVDSLPWNRWQEWIHQNSDVFYKVGEASRSYDDLMRAVGEADVGDVITFQTKPGRSISITRNTDGWRATDANAYTPAGKSRLLSEGDLQSLVGQAAGHRANALFFDYGDVPLLGKYLRAQPMLGLLSPFYSYTLKSIDLPGKAGLATQALMGSQRWFDSTNTKTTARQAKDILAEGIRRSALMHAGKQALIDENNEELMRPLQYLPADGRMRVLKETANPAYLEQREFGNWNFVGPTLTLFKLVAPKEHGLPIDPSLPLAEAEAAYEKVDRKKARLLRLAETGSLSNAADAINLLGMGGSVVSEILTQLDEAEKQGKDISFSQLALATAPAMLGGNVASALDLAMGATDQLDEFSSRYQRVSPTDKNVAETYLRWAMRKITGLAWRALPVADREKSFKRLGDEWKARLGINEQVRLADKELQQARVNNDLPAAEAAVARKQRAKFQARVVDAEIRLWQAEWDKMYTAGQERLKALSEETPPVNTK